MQVNPEPSQSYKMRRLGVIQALAAAFLLLLAQSPQTAFSQSSQTLNGTFVLRQSDLEAECNFSDAPETNGSFTLTLDGGAGTATGSLQGGGSGTRGLACNSTSPAVTAQMDWQQNYSATFNGTFNPSNGEIVLSGTLNGSNNIHWHDCTSGFQVVECESLGVGDYAQPYTFPITLNGKYDAAQNSAAGTWTVSPIVRPTSGEWTAQGAPPTPTTAPPTATRISPTSIPPTLNIPPPLTATPPRSPAAPGTIILSDDFDVPDGNLCENPAAHNPAGTGAVLYYLPIFPTGGTDASKPVGADFASGRLENNGLDFGGFQFAHSDPCTVAQGLVRGADMGQDLNIRADYYLPTNAAGHVTQAGPYIRSRAAAPGDGIIGGTSAGYWVQLHSSGEIVVKRLNPWGPVANSCLPPSFDPTVPHALEIAAVGDRVQVALDGRLVTFAQENEFVTAVNIPATAGSNEGTAGIAFGAELNRGQIGGQWVDNLVVSAYRPLDELPVQNNCVSQPSSTAPPAPTATATHSPAPTLISSLATPSPVAPGSGDCDNDGRQTELDALCALQISVQLFAPNPAMDVDGNGVVDSRDAVIILQRAIGK